MFEFKITLLSKSEVIFGLHFDQGEYEKAPDDWKPFNRLRVGFIFFTLEFMKF
jgi:hypothetical protein